MKRKKFQSQFAFNYVIFFLLAIYVATVLLADFPSVEIHATFASSFIEWFGVLYGILLPLILVRVWEQLDDIDREFDREADAIRMLYEDLSFLRGNSKREAREITRLLREYVRHISKNYQLEVKESPQKKKRIDAWNKFKEWLGLHTNSNEDKNVKTARRVGDGILIKIRKQFADLIRPAMVRTKDAEILIPELFKKLNEIVDIRGDRIGAASQRIFETLRLVALLTSIIFLVPFYIVGFTDQTSVLDNILIFGLTLLVIFIYMIIEDFDEPFGGTWKIDDESWYLLRYEMVCDERKLGLEGRMLRNPLARETQRFRHHRSEHLKRNTEMRMLTHLAGSQIAHIKATKEEQRKEAIRHGSSSSTQKPAKRKKSR